MLRTRALAHMGGTRPTQIHVDEADGKIVSRNLRLKLQVETKVTKKDGDFLKRNGKRLVKIIEATGLKLEFSAAVEDRTHTTLYNYWDLKGDANTLIRADYILPDEPAYAEFDRFIISEIKNIAIPLTAPDLLEEPALRPGRLSDLDRHIRVVHQVPEHQLPEFVAKREAGILGFAKLTGWRPIDAYLNVTGRAGRILPIVEVWKIPQGNKLAGKPNVAKIRSAVRKAPWQSLTKGGPDNIQVLNSQLLPKSTSHN